MWVKVRNCADLVVEEILKHQIKDIVIHSLSNNGAALYQHLTQTAAVRSGKIAVKVMFRNINHTYADFITRALYLTQLQVQQTLEITSLNFSQLQDPSQEHFFCFPFQQ